jgi:integrase
MQAREGGGARGSFLKRAFSCAEIATCHCSKKNRTVITPLRRPNAELRTREYLTDAEVAKLTEAAKDNRHGYRDATMILLAYRHGFRASELVDLRWDQIDFARAWPSVGLSAARPARIRFLVTSCAPFASYSASRSPSRRSCSRRNAARPSPRQALRAS